MNRGLKSVGRILLCRAIQVEPIFLESHHLCGSLRDVIPNLVSIDLAPSVPQLLREVILAHVPIDDLIGACQLVKLFKLAELVT